MHQSINENIFTNLYGLAVDLKFDNKYWLNLNSFEGDNKNILGAILETNIDYDDEMGKKMIPGGYIFISFLLSVIFGHKYYQLSKHYKSIQNWKA